MIGVGIFEIVVGLLIAALIIYFVFRDRRSVVLVLLLLVLSPILGVFIAMAVAYARYALFGG